MLKIISVALAESTSSIQLPADFNANILSQATAFLSNLSGYLTLIIGILLGLVAVEIIIGVIRR